MIERRSSPDGSPRSLVVTAGIAWRLIVIVVAISLVVWSLATLYLVVMPVTLAIIIATVLIPMAEWLERRGMGASIAGILVVTGSLLFVVLLFAAIAPSFADQVRDLIPTARSGYDDLVDWSTGPPLNFDASRIAELTAQARDSVSENQSTLLGGLVTGATVIGQTTAALVLTIVLLFFFVKDRDEITGWMRSRLPEAQRDVVVRSSTRAWTALSGYVRGTATIAFIDAVLIAVGCAIFDIPLALPIGVLVFFGAFLPVIGALLSGSVAILVALADGGFELALIAAIIVLAVQQIEGNVLQPMIMRRSVNLHPVVVLLALAAGTALAGIIGAFLSVPIAAVVAAVGNELRLAAEQRADEAATEAAAAGA